MGNKAKQKIYRKIFFSTLYLSTFTFGGGYAAMPLIQAQVVEQYGWLSQNDFADLVTIAEMTPGPIAVNAATFVGNQVAGIGGAVVSTVGVILPSCCFVTILAWIYTKCRKINTLQGILKSLRPAVVAMILTAGITVLVSTLFKSGTFGFTDGNLEIRALIMFLVAFVVLRIKKVNPIAVMILCGIVELGCQILT